MISLTNGIPQSEENPMLGILGPTWEQVEAERLKKEAEKKMAGLEQLDSALLDWEGFSKGKPKITSQFSGDEQAAIDRTLAGQFIFLENGMKEPGSPAYRNMLRDRIAAEQFGGVGVGSDSAFVGQVRIQAQKRKDQRELLQGKDETDSANSLLGKIRDAALTGQGWEGSFVEWQKTASGDARFDKGKADIYQSVAEASYLNISKQVDEARPFAEEAMGALMDEKENRGAYGGTAAIAAIEKAPAEARPMVMALLFQQAKQEGDKQGSGGHAWQTFARGMAKQMLIGPSSTLAARDLIQAEEELAKIKPGDEFGGRFTDLLSAAKGSNDGSLEGRMLGVILEPLMKNQVATEESIAAAKAELARQKDRFQISKTLEGVAQGTIDPLRPSNWFQEKIAYPFMGSVAPSVASVILTKKVTGSGLGGAFTMWGMMADDNAQQYMRQGQGIDFAKAYEMGQRAAVYQAGLEYAETALTLGGGKVLGNALKTAQASAWKTFGKAAGANVIGQNFLEGAQDILPFVIQELDATTPSPVARDFFYGQDGQPGFWAQRVDTFWALLPAVAMGAGGATIQAKASRAELERIAATTQDEKMLKAAGITAEKRAEIIAEPDAALRLNKFAEGIKTADPAIAKEGQAELDAAEAEREAAEVEAQRVGAMPTFARVADGWQVFDGETGEQVGATVVNPDDALKLAAAHSAAIDEAKADQIAFLASSLEAGEATVKDGTTFEFAPGQKVTATQKAAESEIDEARILEQVAAKEALDGNGDFAGIVLGESVTDFKENVRRTVNRINAGGSALTVFHEESHGFFREALATGRLTKDETVTAIRSFQDAMGERAEKFLPDGEVTDTQIDEAVAEFMEAEILKNRKGGGVRQLPPGVITKNLTAAARLAPGAAKKFARFINTVREFWGATFRRAAGLKKAVREGKVKQDDIDAFVSKLMGLEGQDAHNAQAAQVAEELTGEPAASFSLGPAKMADVLGGEALKRAKTPKAKASIMSDIARRMSGLKRDKDQLISAFGKTTVQKAVVKPRTAAEIREEFARKREGDAAVMESQGRSKEEIAEAMRQIGVSEREALAEQKRDHSPKARLLRSLAMLDGILAALPPDLRGRIGGYTQLAKLGTDEARLEFLKTRIEKANQVVSDWLKKEYTKQLEKLFERAKPAKDEAGKKKVGKAGADVHSLFDTLRDAREWSSEKVEEFTAGREAAIAKGEMTPEQEAHAIMEVNLVSLIGDWRNADAARREAAVAEATRVFDAGYATFKLAKLMEKEDREIRRHNLADDTGKQGTPGERDTKMVKENGLKAGWKNVILSLSSFDQVADYIFGRESAEAKRIVDMEREASARKEDAIQGAMDGLDGLFNGLAGGELAGQQLRYDLSQKTIKVGDRLLSPMEAITATLMWRQEDGRRHMLGKQDDQGNYNGPWHYDQDFVDALEAELSPEAVAVRDHIADAYSKEWDRLNPIYVKLNGVALPKNDAYSPITVKPQQAQGGQMVDPVTGSSMSGSSLTPGSLRTRGHSIAEPEFRDALQTYIAHTKQMEHWMAYAPFTAEAGAILRNRELGNHIEAKAGEQGLSVLRSWLDFFAQGGTRDAAAHLEVNKMLGRMTNRAAGAALVGRIGVLAVQSTQLGAALAEMPTGAYLKRLGALFTGNLGWGAAMKSEYIQRRLNQMPPVVQQAMEGLKASEPNNLKFAVQKMGRVISGTDALMTAGTYAIVHDYQLSQAKAMGMSGAEAEAWAASAAERSVDRIAQPTRAGARSLYENTATNPIVRVTWAFASESRQKLMLAAWAMGTRPLGEKLRVAAVTWLVGGLGSSLIRAAWRDLRNDDDDEVFDEKNWGAKRLALSSLTGPFGGLPVFGDLIEGAAFAASGEYLPEGNLLSGGSTIGRSWRAATRDDWGDGKPDDIMRWVESILGVAGLANDSVAAAASISHLVRDLWNVVENATE